MIENSITFQITVQFNRHRLGLQVRRIRVFHCYCNSAAEQSVSTIYSIYSDLQLLITFLIQLLKYYLSRFIFKFSKLKIFNISLFCLTNASRFLQNSSYIRVSFALRSLRAIQSIQSSSYPLYFRPCRKVNSFVDSRFYLIANKCFQRTANQVKLKTSLLFAEIIDCI